MNDRLRTYRGAVALVTGGASGIGKAVCEELARRGAHVVIADIQEPVADDTAAGIRRDGGQAEAHAVDVRDFAAVDALVAGARERHGRIDYVFNNAGVGVFGEVHLLEERDWNLVLDVNVGGVVNVIRAAYPRMIEQGYGHLVNTASIAGLLGTPFLGAYVASKHAVVGLSKAMRIEAARFGVRVSTLCPGAVRTPILEGGAFGRTVYGFDGAKMLAWWEKMKPAPVGPFATDVLDAVARNEGLIVLPRHVRHLVRLARMVPGLEESIAARLYHGTVKRHPEVAAATKVSGSR